MHMPPHQNKKRNNCGPANCTEEPSATVTMHEQKQYVRDMVSGKRSHKERSSRGGGRLDRQQNQRLLGSLQRNDRPRRVCGAGGLRSRSSPGTASSGVQCRTVGL